MPQVNCARPTLGDSLASIVDINVGIGISVLYVRLCVACVSLCCMCVSVLCMCPPSMWVTRTPLQSSDLRS